MHQPNPYQSSNAKPQALEPSEPFMLRLLVVLLSTSAGCGLAAAIGYWGAIVFDAITPAVVAMAVLPAAGAWLAGVREPNQLLKIAAYGVVVWLLCFMLEPAVSGRVLPGTPKVHAWWVAIAFVPSSLLTVIGAGFACREEPQRIQQ